MRLISEKRGGGSKKTTRIDDRKRGEMGRRDTCPEKRLRKVPPSSFAQEKGGCLEKLREGINS